MMKKMIYIGIALMILVGVVIFMIIGTSDNHKNSGIEKNYGLAYQSSNISIIDGELSDTTGKFDASTVVPNRDILIKNLKEKEFEIKYYEKVFDSNIKANQIIATKGEHFVDISYDIKWDEKSIFDLYNEHYNNDKYYILALNGSYVYAISDSKTFEYAGFTTLANDGTQFINHSNQ